MSWQASPYTWLLFLSALLTAGTTVYALRRQEAPGAIYLALLSASACIWSFGFAVATGFSELSTRIFWAKVQYLGIAPAPLMMFYFVVQYVGLERWLTRRNITLLSLIPGGAILLAWTNEAHHLIWTSARIVEQNGTHVMDLTYGPAFWVFAAYSYLMLVLSTILLVRALVTSTHLQRRQSLFVLAALLLPWLGNLAYLGDWFPLARFDWTPVLYSLSSLLIGWSLIRYRLLDLVPIAREKVIESMADALIVIDDRVRIVDVNPAAESILALPQSKIVGQEVVQVLPIDPALLQDHTEVVGDGPRLTLGQGAKARIYQLRTSELKASGGMSGGRVLVLHDVTDSQRAQDSLRRSQQLLVQQNAELNKLTQAVEQSANIVIITDLQGCIQYANPRFEETTGYSLEEALGKKPNILKSGEHSAGYYEDLWGTIRAGGVWRGQFCNRRKDGSLYWEQASIAPVFDNTGKMTNYVAIKGDITARKETEAALARQAERLRILNEIRQSILAASLPDTVAMAAVRRIRKLVPCQRTMALALGSGGKLELLAAESDGDSELELDLGIYQDLLNERVLKGGWVKGVADLKDLPEPKPFQAALLRAGVRSYVIAPLRSYDEVVGTLNLESCQPGVFEAEHIAVAAEVASSLALAIRQVQLYEQAQQELSERILVERRLRDRERFLALLNDITATALETPDLQTMLQVLADRLGDLFYADGCYILLWDEDAQLSIPQAAHGAWRERYRSVRPTPGEPTVTARVLETGKPEVIPDVSDTPYLSQRFAELFPDRSLLGLPLIAGGQKLGAALIAFTEPHQFTPGEIARGEQAAAEIALAIAKAQLVEALQSSIVELEARNEELDAFAHTVAHDLKNPVSTLVGYADMLMDEYGDSDDELLAESVPVIAEHGRRMNTIIAELLLMASVRSVAEVKTESLDMATLVGDALAGLHRQFEEVEAEIVLPDTWPSALGYGPWVVEVWSNYISNALKYGGSPPRIELGAIPPQPIDGDETSSATHQVRFYVRDNGPGIPPKKLERLFIAFEQLHQSRVEGHGLGLSIVQRIVHKLGGQVYAETSTEVSGESSGSTFWFTLPATPTQPPLL